MNLIWKVSDTDAIIGGNGGSHFRSTMGTTTRSRKNSKLWFEICVYLYLFVAIPITCPENHPISLAQQSQMRLSFERFSWSGEQPIVDLAYFTIISIRSQYHAERRPCTSQKTSTTAYSRTLSNQAPSGKRQTV